MADHWDGCIVCGGHSVANVGALFAKGKLRKLDNGTYELPEIPRLPVCNDHSSWDKYRLEPYARRRIEELVNAG